jgi:GNAT superfamily N-acetyltransferase
LRLDGGRTLNEYRALFDAHLRGRLVPDHRDAVSFRDLSALDLPVLDEFILAHRDRFSRSVEWTVHTHDLPPWLPERLRAAGFAPESSETVMIGPAADVAGAELPAGLTLRSVCADVDLARIQALQETVWGVDHSWLPGALASALTGSDGDPCVVYVVESGTEVVCAAWIRFHTGTSFASLWGGSTLPSWRGRGIYRTLVARRARLAAARGFSLLRVDASAASEPILRRLGFSPVTTITPWVYSR